MLPEKENIGNTKNVESRISAKTMSLIQKRDLLEKKIAKKLKKRMELSELRKTVERKIRSDFRK